MPGGLRLRAPSSFQRKYIVLGTISRAPNEASFYCYWLQKAEDAIIIINGIESALLLTRDAHLRSCLGLARAQKTEPVRELLRSPYKRLQPQPLPAMEASDIHPNIFKEKASPLPIITNNFCAVLVCQIGAAERQWEDELGCSSNNAVDHANIF